MNPTNFVDLSDEDYDTTKATNLKRKINQVLETDEVVLYQIPGSVNAKIVKRPSKYCKSPYMADAIIESSGEEKEIMAHTPSLGCCGLVEKECNVILSKVESKTAKSSHRVELSVYKEGDNKEVIGVNPKLAESIAERCLQSNCIGNLKNVKSYKREVTLLNSRFDFVGVDEDGREFVMEVKTVPLADYIDAPKKDKIKLLKNLPDYKKEFGKKIAYFPDGYKKKNTSLVSPRALKHIQELEELVKSTAKRCIMCYIIQRSDVSSFQPSNIDPEYKRAVQNAFKNGVEIKTVQVKWTDDGKCVFVRNDLPINL